MGLEGWTRLWTCHVDESRGASLDRASGLEGGLGYAGPRLSDVAELLRLSQRLKLLERLILDLPDPLARHVERPPDLVERARVLATEPVAQLEHAALPVAEVLERLAERLLGEDLGRPLVRRLGALVRDELPE